MEVVFNTLQAALARLYSTLRRQDYVPDIGDTDQPAQPEEQWEADMQRAWLHPDD